MIICFSFPSCWTCRCDSLTRSSIQTVLMPLTSVLHLLSVIPACPESFLSFHDSLYVSNPGYPPPMPSCWTLSVIPDSIQPPDCDKCFLHFSSLRPNPVTPLPSSPLRPPEHQGTEGRGSCSGRHSLHRYLRRASLSRNCSGPWPGPRSGVYRLLPWQPRSHSIGTLL